MNWGVFQGSREEFYVKVRGCPLLMERQPFSGHYGMLNGKGPLTVWHSHR